MSRAEFSRLCAQRRVPIDFVKHLLPWHLGGAYAYLANDLTIGAMIVVGFLLINKLGD